MTRRKPLRYNINSESPRFTFPKFDPAYDEDSVPEKKTQTHLILIIQTQS